MFVAIRAHKLVIKVRHVEWGIVNEEFRAPDEPEKFAQDVAEARLTLEHVARDPVHRRCHGVDLAPGVEILIVTTACEPIVYNLNATDRDDSVSFG